MDSSNSFALNAFNNNSIPVWSPRHSIDSVLYYNNSASSNIHRNYLQSDPPSTPPTYNPFKFYSIFDQLWDKQMILKLPPNWHLICIAKVESNQRYILITTNCMERLTYKIIIAETLAMGYYFKDTFLPYEITERYQLKEHAVNYADIENSVFNYDSMPKCNGGPSVIEYPCIKTQLASVDCMTRKWRHKRCMIGRIALEECCLRCGTLEQYFCKITQTPFITVYS